MSSSKESNPDQNNPNQKSESTFVDELEDIRCVFCHIIARRPAIIKPCHHYICVACYSPTKEPKICPRCNRPITYIFDDFLDSP